MTDWPHLTTDRLILRALRQEDAAELARIGGDPRVAPMIFVASSPWPVEDAAEVIAQAAYDGGPAFRVAVALKERGTFIGMLSLFDDASIGYFIDPAQARRGYASEAVSAFVEAAFASGGMEEVKAEVFTDNPASTAMLLKLGFEETGKGMAKSRARLEPAPVKLYRRRKAQGTGT
ncbi:GNAT family N-acetyltransferase [Thalassococcus sp. S3]|uniref:GNAT family N-acetyltransferase n=1 Tax=Thalassococcus sp. S3 TaxID=2017482 RepID=UPI0010245CD7|nr:GNAT family protein [Thalassococcus sp. S3]QBF31960.1 hypothetical protein CFI11_12110 [Thalassococcus sp. S3]